MFLNRFFSRLKIVQENQCGHFLLILMICAAPGILFADNQDFFFGSRVKKNTIWIGNKVVSPSISILVLAGHADSQNMQGEGTSGEAVGIKGFPAMDTTMSDELFWNLKVRDAVVSLGKKKGLVIAHYEPGLRTIIDENDEKSNWSVGSRHAAQGGYVFEIHFDAYGEEGLGAGLIPPLSPYLNNIDESLAQTFGRYPLFFRGGLGAPRRQIRILEIGKVEGDLEKKLRDLKTREVTIDQIANSIIDAIINGINNRESFNPLLPEGDIFLPDFHL